MEKTKKNVKKSSNKSAPTAATEANSKKAKRGSLAGVWMREMRYGETVPVDFFTRNAWILVILLVAILSLIGLRYKTKTKMAEIKSLEHQLELAQSAKLREKADYMSLIRETEMRRLVNEKRLGLVFQEQPPYEVELSE
ncbi:MAG: hypothetical protein K2M31_09475 [Muribaculaceae bacterium]|nr:hypothetical protein [Muribaculaceae bacterium]